MLFATDGAFDAILRLVSTSDQATEEAGVWFTAEDEDGSPSRFTAEDEDGSPSRFEVAVVSKPTAGDTLLESCSTRIYLDDAAGQALTDAILNAQLDPLNLTRPAGSSSSLASRRRLGRGGREGGRR
jgi:hypothetical protein